MQRTLINLDPDDKAWLDRVAREQDIPMTEVVRQAVRAHRLREESHGHQRLQQAIRDTRGIWRAGDGLDYQQAVREEWDAEA